MADKMDIRLDSTSPVRQVQWNKKDKQGNINPFAYNISKSPKEEYKVPNFKSRSTIGENDDVISKVTKPRSVISNIPGQNMKTNKLLEKEQHITGSYLNAKALEVIVY